MQTGAVGAAREHFRLRILLLPLVCFLLLTAACLEQRLPEGIVATVNGERITLRSVHALLDTRLPALGGGGSMPSLDNLRRVYGDALCNLILYTLVRQELARLNLSISAETLEERIVVIQNDYGSKAGLQQYLSEHAIDPEEWRALVCNHLSLVRFKEEVLLPQCAVSLEEVHHYYAEHAVDFQLPAAVHVCLVHGNTQAGSDAACTALFSDSKKFVQQDATVQCQLLKQEDVPREWRSALKGIPPGECLPSRQVGNAWHAIALLERRAVGSMPIAEAFPLIEVKLQEHKITEAFARWLEQVLANAHIRVDEELASELRVADVPATSVQSESSDRDSMPSVSAKAS